MSVVELPAGDVRPGDVVDTAAGADLVELVRREPARGLVHLHLRRRGLLSVPPATAFVVLSQRSPFGGGTL